MGQGIKKIRISEREITIIVTGIANLTHIRKGNPDTPEHLEMAKIRLL